MDLCHLVQQKILMGWRADRYGKPVDVSYVWWFDDVWCGLIRIDGFVGFWMGWSSTAFQCWRKVWSVPKLVGHPARGSQHINALANSCHERRLWQLLPHLFPLWGDPQIIHVHRCFMVFHGFSIIIHPFWDSPNSCSAGATLRLDACCSYDFVRQHEDPCAITIGYMGLRNHVWERKRMKEGKGWRLSQTKFIKLPSCRPI